MAAPARAGIASGCNRKTGITAVASDVRRYYLRIIIVRALLLLRLRPPIPLPLLFLILLTGGDCWRTSSAIVDPPLVATSHSSERNAAAFSASCHLSAPRACFVRPAVVSRVSGTGMSCSSGRSEVGGDGDEYDLGASGGKEPPSSLLMQPTEAVGDSPSRDVPGLAPGGGDGVGGSVDAPPPGRPVLCTRCRGEGTSRARLSKKERFRRKRAKRAAAANVDAAAAAAAKSGVTGVDVDRGGGDGTTPQPQPRPQPPESSSRRMEPCRLCGGSGLLPSPDDREGGKPTTTTAAPTTIAAASQHDTTVVAIVGGGIGGCALALALQHRGVPCVVYERDVSFDERRQGYGLTMQQGARALRALGFFMPQSSQSSVEGGGGGEKDGGGEDGDGGGETRTTRPVSFGIHSKRHVVHTPNGTVVGRWGLDVWGRKAERDSNRQNAHISRQGLRRMLLDRLEPGTVRWGHRLVRYEEVMTEGGRGYGGGGAVEITLRRRRARLSSSSPQPDDGGQGGVGTLAGGGDGGGGGGGDDDDNEEVDDIVRCRANVLVGADGIRSAVRRQKLGEEAYPLRYLGCIVILGIAPSPHPPSSSLGGLTDGETVFQTADGTTRIYAMPFSRPGGEESTVASRKGGGETMWQLSFPMDESDAIHLSVDVGSEALKEEAYRRCGTWHRPIPELIRSTPVDLVSGYPVYDREIPTVEDFRDGITRSQLYSSSSEVAVPSRSTPLSRSRVTLIGDAAHPMSPFKGQGANQALLDAVQLARSLYKIFDTSSPSSPSKKVETAKKPDDDDGRGDDDDDGIPDALAVFEKEMLRRSSVKVRASADAARFLHTDVAVMEGNVTRAAAAKAAAAASKADDGVVAADVDDSEAT